METVFLIVAFGLGLWLAVIFGDMFVAWLKRQFR